QHVTARLHQLKQQVKLFRREGNQAGSDKALPAFRKNLYSAGMHNVRAAGSDASKNGFHAKNKFSWRKRFGDVVISAQLEPNDSVDLLASSSQHQNGNAARRGLQAESAANLKAVNVRKHDVENNKVRRLLLNKIQSLASGSRDLNFEA